MQPVGRISKLLPKTTEAYDCEHAAVWPEVRAAIAEAGIRNFTIFRHGVWVFAYFELPAGVTAADVAAVMEQSPACQRWEDRMRALRDPAFAVDWLPMTEVFRQDTKDHALAGAATMRTV